MYCSDECWRRNVFPEVFPRNFALNVCYLKLASEKKNHFYLVLLFCLALFCAHCLRIWFCRSAKSFPWSTSPDSLEDAHQISWDLDEALWEQYNIPAFFNVELWETFTAKPKTFQVSLGWVSDTGRDLLLGGNHVKLYFWHTFDLKPGKAQLFWLKLLWGYKAKS